MLIRAISQQQLLLSSLALRESCGSAAISNREEDSSHLIPFF